MNGLEALNVGLQNGIEQTHSSTFTLHAPTPITFSAIRRQRFRNLPDGGVVVELTLICRRSAFGAVRPREGWDVSAGSERWRLAIMQPGEVAEFVELVLESEVR